jgi:hypothetical protein
MSVADRYKIAYTKAWASLVDWKKIAITEYRTKGVDNRFEDEFVKEVSRLFEME